MNTATPSTKPSLASTLAYAGKLVEEAGPGVRAELRRLDPGREEQWQSGAFYRLMAYLEPERNLSAERERLWAALLGGLAVLTHAPGGPRAGTLLAQHGLSELRLARLLEAGPAQLPAQLRAVVHYLVAKGVARVDWLPLAQLLFERRNHDQVRRRLARDYYRAPPTDERS